MEIIMFTHHRYWRVFLVAVLIYCCRGNAHAVLSSTKDTVARDFIARESGPGFLALVNNGVPIPMLVDPQDHKGVLRAFENLKKDFIQVTGHGPDQQKNGRSNIIIGTYGNSSLIDSLMHKGLLDSSALAGKREKFIMTVVNKPLWGIDSALVIAGSDKRGTIYGIYELSALIGVSPWYYWADVPIRKATALYAKPGLYTQGEPKVNYRGIFLNDEAPALSGWSKATFGGFNADFYEKVFELLLRLKANYLWPAMWGSAFYDDDPKNGPLADEMGIIMGTSHHEPMARAQAEWKRYGNGGAWDYAKNKAGLQKFWRSGIERARNWESILTIAMRGDGDEPMSEKQNVSLLEQIVRDQRRLIAEATGRPAAETPQLWALYKEVQDYYDKGMRVPDDVTLLLCDDNWGNVRKLPDPNATPRKGGYGMYYHFDYVGAPRNTKWINVSQMQRIWEQMNLTYRHGVDRIWIVNVGDLKPMEFPISFFLDMAWNPDRFNANNLMDYTREWCRQQFGEAYATEAASMINRYTKYNHRVTPELLNERTFSLTHYNEFDSVVNDYNRLAMEASRLHYLLPDSLKDAFDQLVAFPINACANLYEMYHAKAMNDYYYARNDRRANDWADKVKACFLRDSLFTHHYNHSIAKGKWIHMMDQVRIGYSSWNEPPKAIMPAVHYLADTAVHRSPKVFSETDGYIAMEAASYAVASSAPGVQWVEIPDLGKTVSAMTTQPVTASLGNNTALEYKIRVKEKREAKIIALLSPTLNFNGNRGLRYAISIDDGPEKLVNFNGHYKGELGQWQARRIIESVSVHSLLPGEHTLRIRFLDQGIVLQRILIDFGGLKPSYLGPRQSATAQLIDTDSK
ncbi:MULTISPECIES: glycosyl hydrolase 115 family protein [unclassified Sphingobacterium]|uniref:glycosyl hydrolase 115 family protein n=1 Tax=unclassified Sphingobacterium TaxID=2609468 RepID=UPI0025F03C56|nr:MULTISPECIES: glycosyl hydrolase 115 family protein [unclassified Sphingobacterium]